MVKITNKACFILCNSVNSILGKLAMTNIDELNYIRLTLKT
jgi:hypothetical protein